MSARLSVVTGQLDMVINAYPPPADPGSAVLGGADESHRWVVFLSGCIRFAFRFSALTLGFFSPWVFPSFRSSALWVRRSAGSREVR